MSYCHVNVTLTPGQIKKLQSKNFVTCDTKIPLKDEQMTTGRNKLLLTNTQLTHFNKAKTAGTGIQLTFSQAVVNNMIKTGARLLLAALAPSALSVLKALGFFAVGAAGSKLMGRIMGNKKQGSGYTKKGKGFRLPGSRYPKHYGSGLETHQGCFIGPFSLANRLME